MEIINKRVKMILEEKKISQSQFSKKIESTQQYVSAVLKGDRKVGSNISERILKAYPDINKYWLLTGEGEMFKGVKENYKSEIKEVEFDEFMEAEYLPIKVQAGYLNGLEENKPIGLKKMLVPKEFEKGFYKVIEIEGDSMNDGTPRSICDGDKLLLKEVEGGDYLKKILPYRNNLFVIVSREGIVCKQIISQDIEKECIICHSFNTFHADYEIFFEDIHQLFYVKKLVERKIKF